MFRALILFVLSSGVALASDDFSCEKKSAELQCKSKKDVDVALLAINGGECLSPLFRKHVIANETFKVPGTKDCFYARSITLSIDGKSKTFAPF